MATVVVVLSGVWLRSSRPSLAVVMTASVVSGVISETEPTNVVLPTPKPPATTIFTDVIADSADVAWTVLELPKSTEYPFEQVDVRATLCVVDLVDPDESFHRHVCDQDTGDAQRHPQHRRDFRDRAPVTAEPEDGLTLGAEHRQVASLVVRRCDHGLDLKLVARLGPAAGYRIGTDESAALLPHAPRSRVVGPGIARRGSGSVPRDVVKVRGTEVIATHWVQALARIPVIAAVAKHGSLLSLSAALSPARVAAAHFGRQGGAHTLDQQRHLVGHQAHVAVGCSQHSQARAIADGHNDKQATLHLHDGLRHGATLEHARRALRQARQPGGNCCKLVDPVRREPMRERHRQSV